MENGYFAVWTRVAATLRATIGVPQALGQRDPCASPRVDTTFTTIDGRTVEIRPVEPADREPLQAFVRALAPQTRRRRFFSPIRELSKSMLDAITHPAPAREKVLVAAAGTGVEPRIVAVAQYAAAETDGDCEVAVVVADDAQGQGLGARMMAMLIEAARRAGFRRAVGDVLPDNRPMLTLARRAGFDLGDNAADPDLTRIVRLLERRVDLSWR